MRQTGTGGVLGESLPRLEEFLAVGVCGDGGGTGLLLGSSGRRERTGGGTVRTAEGEAGEVRALLSLGREANGRSIGAGLEAAGGAAAVGVLPGEVEVGTSEACETGVGDGEGAEDDRTGGLTSLSSIEKETVLRRFLSGGRRRIGEEGRGYGEDGGTAVGVFSSSESKRKNKVNTKLNIFEKKKKKIRSYICSLKG